MDICTANVNIKVKYPCKIGVFFRCHQNKPFSFKIERPDDPHMLKLKGEKAKEALDNIQKPLKKKNDG